MNVGRIRHLLSDAMLASYPTYESHRICRPDKAFSQHPALIVGCDACASYPTYKSHRTVGRIRRLRRIRQIVNCSYFFASATTLLPTPRLLYSHMRFVVSVIQIALYFVVIIYAAGITRKRTIRDHPHRPTVLAVLKPSLMALSRITT